jgi:S-adenosylmethionine-dependent methyltransferase
MPDDISDIREFYDKRVDNESGRLERHPVEHDVTWRFLDKYLPPAGRVLDIGAAAGVYTIPLAKRGYSVTAADLSPGLIGECEKRVRENGLEDRVKCIVSDARDLAQITDADYDAVLLLGPLYHLVYEEDRLKVLKEVYSRMKPGGIIFSSHISRYGIWGDVLMSIPHYIEYRDDVNSVFATGRDLDTPSWGPGGFRACFSTVPEITPLHEQCGFRTLAIAGMEPAGVAADESYGNLGEEQRQLWLDLLVRISTEPSVVGASCHILYIGEKVN